MGSDRAGGVGCPVGHAGEHEYRAPRAAETGRGAVVGDHRDRLGADTLAVIGRLAVSGGHTDLPGAHSCGVVRDPGPALPACLPHHVGSGADQSWAVPDLTKPGIAAAGPEHREWLPSLAALYHRHEAGKGHCFILELALPAEASQSYGCPRQVVVMLDLPDGEPVLRFDVRWFDKPACRLPEAVWLTFNPHVQEPTGWALAKLGQEVSPFDVIDPDRRCSDQHDQGTYDNRRRFADRFSRGTCQQSTDGHGAEKNQAVDAHHPSSQLVGAERLY